MPERIQLPPVTLVLTLVTAPPVPLLIAPVTVLPVVLPPKTMGAVHEEVFWLLIDPTLTVVVVGANVPPLDPVVIATLGRTSV